MNEEWTNWPASLQDDANMPSLLDSHCHLDLYPDPAGLARKCEQERIYVLAVTNAPSVFEGTRKLVANSKFVRAAVGLHPELAAERQLELPILFEALGSTRYVGEVGLDYRRTTKSDKASQRRVFAAIVERAHLAGDKVLTVHSPGAAQDVLATITDSFNGQVILHWYSDSLSILESAVRSGCFFSINPAMCSGKSFDRFLARIPISHVLTETDGPFVQMQRRPAVPSDVLVVLQALAKHWGVATEDARATVLKNFRTLVGAVPSSPN